MFIELTCLKIYHRYMGQNITKHFRLPLLIDRVVLFHRVGFLSPRRRISRAGSNEFYNFQKHTFEKCSPHRISAFSIGDFFSSPTLLDEKEPDAIWWKSTRLVTLQANAFIALMVFFLRVEWNFIFLGKLPSRPFGSTSHDN